MKRRWRKSELLLFPTPLLMLAGYYALPYVRNLWGRDRLRPLPFILRLPGNTNALRFSPDSKMLASGGGNGYTRLWDVRTGLLLHQFDNGNRLTTDIAFSPNGKMLAVVTQDQNKQTLRVWNLQSRTTIYDLPPNGAKTSRPGCLSFSPDSRLLASAGKQINLWDMKTGTLLRKIGVANYWVHRIAFSFDGRFITCQGDQNHEYSFEPRMPDLRLWDLQTGKLIQTYPSQRILQALSAGGERAVELNSEWNYECHCQLHLSFILLDVKSRRRLWSQGFGSSVDEVAFSRTGRMLAVASTFMTSIDSRDPNVRLFDARNGAPLKSPALPNDFHGTTALAFSPDEKLLAVAEWTGRIHLFEVGNVEQLKIGSNP